MPFMASTIPGTSLKRMMLSLLLITIYTFVGIKIAVACSAPVCNWAIKNVSKEMIQTHVGILHFCFTYDLDIKLRLTCTQCYL